MKQLYVKDITPDLQGIICDWFLLTEKQTKLTKGGKAYLCLKLADKTGDIECKMWDTAAIPAEVGDAVKVEATASEYNGKPQLTVNRLRRPVEKETLEINDGWFYPESEFDRGAMFDELMSIVESETTGEIQRLLRAIFSDQEILGLYRDAPAAHSMHHAFLGGLIEHSLSLVRAARAISAVYGLDTELMIAAAVLHDIGKIYELAPLTREYTEDGLLLGHIPMGYELVTRYCRELQIDPKTSKLLRHVILAHHGQKDFGSPVEPGTREAIALHYCDQIDSKFGAIAMELRKPADDDEPFTPWLKATGTRIMRDTTRVVVPAEDQKFDKIPTDA